MAGAKSGVVRAVSEGGVAGAHHPAGPFEFVVGPTTTDQLNTAHLPLIPIACFRVDDVRFAFGSSFVNSDPSDLDNPNDIRAELAHLVSLVKDHVGAPLSVFGHADPVGSDDYNKLLSGRRAMAIYALLVANGEPDTAVSMWNFISHEEHWGNRERDAMRTFTGLRSDIPDSLLFRSYQQKLCPPELTLTRTDFLAQGKDLGGRIHGGKGDFQGCGEFNPVMLVSKEKQAEFDRAQRQGDKDGIEKRNAANTPNRRVLILMFRKGSRVEPARWPCPRATEGVAGCVKRFWSDGETRRSTHLPNNVDRRFEDKKDTFACRFYQRISDGSPCERIVELVPLTIRLIDDQVINGKDEPFDGLSYKLEVGGLKFNGGAAAGLIQHRVPKGSTQGTLTLIHNTDEGDAKILWTLDLEIVDNLDDISKTAGAQARLNNLGLFAGDGITGQVDGATNRALQRFQTLYKVTDDEGNPDTSGILTERTAVKLKEIHGA